VNSILLIVIFLIFALLTLVTALVGSKIYRRRIHLWLWEYLAWQTKSWFLIKEGGKKKHVMLFITDHFEPRFGQVSSEKEMHRVKVWCEKYNSFSEQFKDSSGRLPQHTWFYPFDEKNDYCLSKLRELTERGLGEIEFHLHHSGDSGKTFEEKIKKGLEWFNRFGALISKRGDVRFGFIHGMYALANSDPRYCGVNNEISILESFGCYADFTFPAYGTPSQPRIINTLYYPAKNGNLPKSYDHGIELEVNRPGTGMILFEGPLYFDPVALRFDDGRVDQEYKLSHRRLRNWLRANVHVKGKPEWVFIKLFSHSAREKSREAFFSPETDRFYEFVISKSRRGLFVLHFVTAREAFNIAKAAEHGEKGSDPMEYVDYVVAPPVNRGPFR